LNKQDTISAIIKACDDYELPLIQHKAYVIATAYHETAHTFKPVKEAFWKSEDWRKENFRYYPYYGRGFIQITWEDNYNRFGMLLKIDLANNPDLALEPKNAMKIMLEGFKYGRFTGKKLEHYIDGIKTDYINARRCINGTDRAEHIAGIAKIFERALYLQTGDFWTGGINART